MELEFRKRSGTNGFITFPLKIIWNPWNPSKVSFIIIIFGWKHVGKRFCLWISLKRGWTLVNRRAL